MNWYKVKSVLIALFLLIDVILGSLILLGNIKRSATDRKSIESVVQLLKANNINISKDSVDQRPAATYAVTIVNPMSQPEEFANKMLGGNAEQNDSEYTYNTKKLKIDGISFEYSDSAGTKTTTPSHSDIKSVKKELQKMGLDMRYAKGHIENDSIIFNIYIKGHELFGSKLSVTLSDGTISTLCGSWVAIGSIKHSDVEITPPADALINLLREKGKHTDTINIATVKFGEGLMLSASDYREAEAVPQWKITLENGETYFYDARN